MTSTRRRTELHQRAAKACIPCKAAKKRCVGGIPCAYCVHHKRASNCRYTDEEVASPGVPGGGNDTSFVLSRNPPLAPNPVLPSLDQMPAVVSPTTYSEVDTVVGNTASNSINTESPATTMSFVPARLLRNPRGNEVYLGSNAIISFLPLLRSIFKQSVGPTAFTEAIGHSVMLESQPPTDGPVPVRDTTTLAQKLDLVKIFFASTSGVLDIVNMSDIVQAIKMDDAAQEVDPQLSAVSSLMVAIGAQIHPDNMSYRVCERVHFERARPSFSLDKLEDISLNRVRLFILAAVYMITACNRNMGYMYLGLAARAAHVMGLQHTGLFPNLPEEEKDSRIRLWKSLRVLETLVSSFLGRPAATLHPSREQPGGQLATRNSAGPRSVPIDANYQLLEILDDILDNVNRQNIDNIAVAKTCIDRLTDWSSTLPQILCNTTEPNPVQMSYQEQTIGNLHLACSYYFAVILVTRPFLIFQCLQKHAHMEVASRSESNATLTSTPAISEDIAMLAKSCEDAAVFMINACHDALREDMLLDNMCLLQAFIFASALVVGLVQFTDNDSEKDVGRSLKEAVAIMEKLGRRSRQAEHYLLILCDMQRDVEQFQEQMATRRRESSRRPVKKLLQLGQRNSQVFPESGTSEVAGSAWAQADGINLDALPFSAFSFPSTAAAAIPDADEVIPSWYFPSIQFWDDAFGTG